MGNTPDSFDKPVFDDGFDLPGDLQDAVDFARKFAFIRSGTAAERGALTSAKTPNGMLFTETDTGNEYLRRGGAWRVASKPLQAWSPTISGLTLGNGTLTTEFQRTGDLVNVIVELLAGSTTVATGALGFTFPDAPKSTLVHKHMGKGLLRYTGSSASASTNWPVEARHAGGSTFGVNNPDASGTPLAIGNNLSNTWPTGSAWGNAAILLSLYLEFQYVAAP